MNNINNSMNTPRSVGCNTLDTAKSPIPEMKPAGETASMVLKDLRDEAVSETGRSRIHSAVPLDVPKPAAFEVLRASVSMESLGSSVGDNGSGDQNSGSIRSSASLTAESYQENSGTSLPLLTREVPVYPRKIEARTPESAVAATLSHPETQLHAGEYDSEQKVLTVTLPVHPRTARSPNETATLPTMPLSPLETQLSLSEVGTETGIGTQTDADKGSSLSRYGALVASSLATILGAVLVIVAKTHGHDEIEVDDAGDIQPAEPDYDALSEQAAQEAEQAFTEKWQDPEMWGPGKVDSDGSNLETGEKNPYYGVAQDQETGEYFIGDNLSLEGERTLEAIKSQASETAVSQAKADYEQMLVEATGHNGSHASGTLRDEKNGRDHDAMIGVGATLIGLGGLATTLIAGNKLTHRSHDKQQAQGLAPEHGPVKNFIEQKLFMVKA